MNHVAGTLGCLMAIHGGSNTETRKVLGDFSLFDIELGEWIKCEVSEDSGTASLTARQMHTMQVVCQTDSSVRLMGGASRQMWSQAKEIPK